MFCSVAKDWRFRIGKESLEDDARTGKTVDAVSDGIITLVGNLILMVEGEQNTNIGHQAFVESSIIIGA